MSDGSVMYMRIATVRDFLDPVFAVVWGPKLVSMFGVQAISYML